MWDPKYINREELYLILCRFVRHLYLQYLMVNSREYRVVIVESIYCPSHFRNTLARALFNHMNVRHFMNSLHACRVCMPVFLYTCITLMIGCTYMSTLNSHYHYSIPMFSGSVCSVYSESSREYIHNSSTHCSRGGCRLF